MDLEAKKCWKKLFPELIPIEGTDGRMFAPHKLRRFRTKTILRLIKEDRLALRFTFLLNKDTKEQENARKVFETRIHFYLNELERRGKKDEST